MPRSLPRGAPAGNAAGCGVRLMTGSCTSSAGQTCTTCARYPSTAAAGSSRVGMMSGVGRGERNAQFSREHEFFINRRATCRSKHGSHQTAARPTRSRWTSAAAAARFSAQAAWCRALSGLPPQRLPRRHLPFGIVPRGRQRSLALGCPLDLPPGARRLIPHWLRGHASIKVLTSAAWPSAFAPSS